MTHRVYKTAGGKQLDLGKLALKNETERAVGNMKVNARGDMLDDANRVIARKTDQVNRHYNKQVTKKT
jgi:hypothetical protein